MRNSARILCVDDEPNVLEGLKRTLRRSFEVSTAAGPEAGLRVIEEEGPFAAIVSDFSMPAMNGVEFFEEARRLSPESARVLLTGNADLDIAIAAVNRGAVFRFLLKPCAPDVLHQALADGVEQFERIVDQRAMLDSTAPRVGAPNSPGESVLPNRVSTSGHPVAKEALMKFLVVESSVTMRRAIINSLHRIGYEDVVEARDAEKALEMFGSSIRCVITGWDLSGMSGLDLIRAVRARRDGRTVPLLVVSSRSARREILEAREAGVSGYIITPFKIEVLQDRLDAVLRATR